jgi:phenylacetate-CoA ligase
LTNDDRELWSAELQALAPEEISTRASSGIAAAWRRVWEAPVPFYQRKYEEAGLAPDRVPALEEIPRTTKDELRADEERNPPFGTWRSVWLEQAVRLGASTGTTGRAVIFFYSERDLDTHVQIGRRSLWRHGLRRGMRFTHSWPQGIYPTGVSAGRQFLELGVLEIPVGPPFTRDTAAEHLRLWDILRPDGFMLTGSQLQTYEDVASEIGVDFRGMLKGGILVMLEAPCQFEGPRARMESTYGFQLRNIGGASEIPGFATSDCRYHRGLHCAGDHFVIQVCDPATGIEVPHGERGTLVITAFDIDATFIRYDLEDIVVRNAEPCPCGETGPRYTLLGRAADEVEIGGRRILPIDIQLALDEEGAPEFQIARGTGASALRLKMEMDGGAASMEERLRERLGITVEVEEIAPGTLPRSTFKPRRVAQ